MEDIWAAAEFREAISKYPNLLPNRQGIESRLHAAAQR